MRVSVVLASLLLGGCAASQPALRDDRFVIVNHGSFTPHELRRVQAQLDAGATALARYLGPIPSGKFPVVVNLRPGRGVSHSYQGQGTS